MVVYRGLLHSLLFVTIVMGVNAQTWEDAKTTGQATLDIYWHTSVPSIFENENGQLEGIEHDLLIEFKRYLKNEKQVDLTLNWTKAKDFSDVLNRSKSASSNFIGISAISITDERSEYASFSTSYLSDVTVLISSRGTQIVRSLAEINDMMQKMTAVTVKDTRYEALLMGLKDEFDIEFDIEFVGRDNLVAKSINEKDDRFGFIDLPIYLILVKDGEELVRQNFFTVKGDGYGLLLAKDSDWKEPIDEFLREALVNNTVATIASKYMGPEVYNFLEKLYGTEEIGTTILTQEKALQLEIIRQANLQMEKDRILKGVMLVGIIVFGLCLTVIGILFSKNQKTTKDLLTKNNQIFQHQEDINLKNEQLINRNTQLMTLNEEKNNLIKILAHDLRSPLSQISMIAEILSKPSDDAEKKRSEFLKQILNNTQRISEMVDKILDVDEIEEHGMKVLRERIDLREILQEIKMRYVNVAAKKEIDLKVILCEDNFVIRTDHLLLTLVLENLVSNAIKFSPPNTQVVLKSKCAYNEVLFTVSDEGPGFTKKDKELAFHKFQKLSARPTGGETSIGLGLSIVKKYVGEMGGDIWLESEEGMGSTFFVKLTA